MTDERLAAVALEQEMNTFRRELPSLLCVEENRGRFALVHGDRVVGTFPGFDAALEVGYERFGLEPFLVRQVTEHEPPRYFSRNVKPRPSRGHP